MGGTCMPLMQSSSAASRCSISNTEPELRIQNLPAETSTSQERRPPASPDYQSRNRRPSPGCCFCWCGSGSCSRTQFQDKPPDEYGTRPTELDNYKPQDDDSPRLEEVRQWGEAFDKVLHSCKGRKVLREFLITEHSDENIMFWIACEELKKEENVTLMRERARCIYDLHVSSLAPKEISLDSRSRHDLQETFDGGGIITPDVFNEAQLQIYTLMQRDSYPRFLVSRIYKNLLAKY